MILNESILSYLSCFCFSEIGDYEKNVNRQVHKYNAYRKAAQSIKNHPNEITCVKDAKKIVSYSIVTYIVMKSLRF